MHADSLEEIKKEWHGSLRSYAFGFFISLLLTCISFFIVYSKLFSANTTLYTLMGLAFLQAAAQLIFFLHVGQEAKPKWETLVFNFMVLVLLIIVLGSLWIMYDLDDRVMNMDNMKQEMVHD